MNQTMQRSLEEGVNLRDLGGMPCTDGSTTRPGVVLRSCAPLYYSKEGLAYLEETLNVQAVVDLRSAGELKKGPYYPGTTSRLLAGGDAHAHMDLTGPATLKVLRRNTNCLEKLYLAAMYLAGYKEHVVEKAIHKLGLKEGGLKTLYSTILVDATAEIRSVMHFIHDKIAAKEVPIIIHCTAGKDRTGIIACLLLLLAGVPHDVIISDYAKSESNLRAHSYVIETQSQFIRDTMPHDILWLSPPEAMQHVLDVIGDVDTYLVHRCGIHHEVVAFIRQSMRH
eukprot:TRINITY_DN43924_c0_g1_i1.p1 TRINITY_DN43924_c0_g1~~TRINITY_DN43924_c0_g1_i1.p1  ORF type:complete len:300 (+),score=51.64 TRINITY_DN43924_c0_g1_i1:59-901(+)